MACDAFTPCPAGQGRGQRRTSRITEDESTITLTFALNIKQFDGHRLILSNNGTLATGRTAPTVKHHPAEHIRLALGLAFAWCDTLLRHKITIADLAREHGLAEGRVHLLLTLTQLSPASTRALLSGSHPGELSLAEIIRTANVLCWKRQNAELLGEGNHRDNGASQGHRTSTAVSSPTSLGAAHVDAKRQS